MKNKIYLLSMLVVLSSCMKLKKKGDEAAPQEVSVQTLSIDTQAKIFDYGYIVDRLRKYQEVEFRFPNEWPEEIVLKKTVMDGSAAGVPEVIRRDESGTWKDSLISQFKVNYEFYRTVGTTLEILDSAEVLPVLELDLKQDRNLAKEFQLNAKTKIIYIQDLQMSANAHLFLEDFSGLIKIANLNSTKGTLHTFPENQRASKDKPGRSGGSLKIEVEKSSGELNLVMVGEDGGDGSAGAEPGEDKRGTAGTNGKPEDYFSDIGSPLPRYTCLTPGGPGGNGGRGLKGNDGNSGMKGGNSGKAAVFIFSGDIVINSFNIAGQKGLGGSPGRGGPGGHRGKSGSSVMTVCPQAPNGEPGLEGDPGNIGHDGRDGMTEKNSQFVNGVKVNFANEN